MTPKIILSAEDRAKGNRLMSLLEGAGFTGLRSDAPDRALAQTELADLILVWVEQVTPRLLERIHQNKAAHPMMPLLVIAHRATPEDLAACTQAGADETCPEPRDLTFLRDRVQALLEEAAHRAASHIERAQKYVATHYSSLDLSLEEIAGHLHLSGAYLSALFSKRCRMHFVDYVHKVRVEAAKRLLETTDLRIYEIAERVGFRSADSFYRVFKAVEGVSPQAYRYGRMR